MKEYSEGTPQCVAFKQSFSIALQVFSSRQISLFSTGRQIMTERDFGLRQVIQSQEHLGKNILNTILFRILH